MLLRRAKRTDFSAGYLDLEARLGALVDEEVIGIIRQEGVNQAPDREWGSPVGLVTAWDFNAEHVILRAFLAFGEGALPTTFFLLHDLVFLVLERLQNNNPS